MIQGERFLVTEGCQLLRLGSAIYNIKLSPQNSWGEIAYLESSKQKGYKRKHKPTNVGKIALERQARQFNSGAET